MPAVLCADEAIGGSRSSFDLGDVDRHSPTNPKMPLGLVGGRTVYSKPLSACRAARAFSTPPI
jgi:hypothetical protein